MHELVIAWITVLAKTAIPLLVLSLGMTSAQLSVGYFWRRRGLLLRSLLAIDVLLPAVALALALLLPIPKVVKIGLVLLAISPGAPVVPMRSVGLGGDAAFTYNLQVVLALSTIVTLPVTLALLGRAFGFPWHVEMIAVSRTVLFGQLLPLGLGLGLRRLLPSVAAWLGPSLNVVANLFLVLLLALFVITRGVLILKLGAIALFSLFAVACAALAIGHSLGGPLPGTRRAVAVAGALRHPGLALLVARVNFPSYSLVPVIIAYLIAASLAVILYRALCGSFAFSLRSRLRQS